MVVRSTGVREMLTDPELAMIQRVQDHPNSSLEDLWLDLYKVVAVGCGGLRGAKLLETVGTVLNAMGRAASEVTAGAMAPDIRPSVPGEPGTCEHCGAYDLYPHEDGCPEGPTPEAWPEDPETDDGMPC